MCECVCVCTTSPYIATTTRKKLTATQPAVRIAMTTPVPIRAPWSEDGESFFSEERGSEVGGRRKRESGEQVE